MGTTDTHERLAWRAVDAALHLPADGRVLVVGTRPVCVRDMLRVAADGLDEMDELKAAFPSRGHVHTTGDVTIMFQNATRVLPSIRGYQLDNVLVDDGSWAQLGSIEEIDGLEQALRVAVLARDGTVDDPTGTIFGPANGEDRRA